MTQPVRLAALTASPAAGYEAPFEMLQACHERVERMLRLLARLREHVAARGADDQARQAARDVMRYFDLAAPQHHLDEERHVFPPLLARGEPGIVALVRRLQDDHAQMEARWAAARAVLDALAQGALAALTPPQEALLEAFAGLYADHIRAEDGIAYPQAQRLLDEPALSRMAQDMMARRGVNLPS